MFLQLDDEELDYVRALAWRINYTLFEDVDEDGNISYTGQLGDWVGMFIRRYNDTQNLRINGIPSTNKHRRKQDLYIEYQFTRKEFESNGDIIEVLEAYGLDIEKFWYLLLFIYDVTIQRTTNVALEDERSDYEKLLSVREYIKGHPNYKIYLSDSSKVPNKNRAECDDFFFFKVFEEGLDKVICQMGEREMQSWKTIDILNKGDYTFSENYQIYTMYSLFHEFFDLMDLPDLRATQHGNSFSKVLLVSRIAYLCRLTRDNAFCDDQDKLKTIIKDNKGKKPKIISTVYM